MPIRTKKIEKYKINGKIFSLQNQITNVNQNFSPFLRFFPSLRK
jgi:hypothetical protein